MKVLLFFAFLLTILGCTGLSPHSNDGDLVKITVLHTNDVHGHAWPIGEPPRGGIAAQAYLVRKIRKEVEKEGGAVLVLSAGDANTGVAESDYFRAKPDLTAMNVIGYDAMVLGNHEFDKGPVQIEEQKKWVRFPFLSANVHYKDEKKELAKPFVVLNKGGVKVGIVGLTTDGLKLFTLPKYGKALNVENPIQAIHRVLPKIKSEGGDFVIALTHIGINKLGKHSKELIVNDDARLAEEVPEIPLIVGGHSHTLLSNGLKVGQTLIVQAGEWSQYLGRVDLEWSRTQRKVIAMQASTIPIIPSEGEVEEIKSLLEQFRKKVQPLFDAVVGIAQQKIGEERPSVRSGENALGNLICDALREETRADVAIFNSGGIRGILNPGPIRVRDIHQAFPFKNTVATTTVSGTLLKKIIAQGIANRHQTGSLLQVSGLSYSFKGNELNEIKVAGLPIQEGRKYKLVTNNFVMGGGDGLSTVVESGPVRDLGNTVDEVLIRYIRNKKSIENRKEGRIQAIP